MRPAALHFPENARQNVEIRSTIGIPYRLSVCPCVSGFYFLLALGRLF